MVPLTAREGEIGGESDSLELGGGLFLLVFKW